MVASLKHYSTNVGFLFSNHVICFSTPLLCFILHFITCCFPTDWQKFWQPLFGTIWLWHWCFPRFRFGLISRIIPLEKSSVCSEYFIVGCNRFCVIRSSYKSKPPHSKMRHKSVNTFSTLPRNYCHQTKQVVNFVFQHLILTCLTQESWQGRESIPEKSFRFQLVLSNPADYITSSVDRSDTYNEFKLRAGKS